MYCRWVQANAVQEPAAFAAYSAALDREEHASQRYARLVNRVDCFRNSPAVAEPDQGGGTPWGWYLWP